MLKLYGYKKCSTCREARKTLEANGAKVHFHDIVEAPPKESTIRSWMQLSDRQAYEFVNVRGTVYRSRHLEQAQFTEDEWVRELSADGKLLKRPILVTDDDVFIGYHEGAFRRIALDEEA